MFAARTELQSQTCRWPRIQREADDGHSAGVGQPIVNLLVMMVAAHSEDLRAAHAVGLKTAFVPRPHEYSPEGKPEFVTTAPVDLTAKDFVHLAEQLGA
jgi:hypothetical protein